MKEKLVFALEGNEGAGKGVQAKLLLDYLAKKGYKVFLTHEPGGHDPLCVRLRENLKYHDGPISSRAEALLFWADRAQHVDLVLKPAQKSHDIILLDRYEAGTFAYQIWARGAGTVHDYLYINYFATQGFKVHFTNWLDIEPEIGLRRNINSGKRKDRFELENLDFHGKVREGFAEYFERFVEPHEYKRFDAALPIDELHVQIVGTLEREFKL